ncbi:MAG: hypothetical protein LBD24_05415 [Spirochaetaceae bacterium]|jgi:hypothetical protein|nr:hypothetical protein [Spirochaetaceae bacterium]
MKKKKLAAKRELLASFTVLDTVYQGPRLMYVAGTIGNPVVSIDSPADSDLEIRNDQPPEDSQDPVLFSYTVPSSSGTDRELRILLAKIHTPEAGLPSTVRYSVIKPSADGSDWDWQTQNITLNAGGAQAATNPHGVAQVGDDLYIIDYDARKVWFVGTAALDSATEGAAVDVAGVIDLSEEALGVDIGLPPDAKGQGIIYLQDGDDEYLFALYIISVVNYPDVTYEPSILMRLTKTGGAFGFNARTDVGRNAQEIIPVTGISGTRLLIPAIGGKQESNLTNGAFSNITRVDPFASTLSADVIIEGDAPAAAPSDTGTYDIAAIAAQAGSASNGGIVYILTFTFGPNFKSLFWKLYKTTGNMLITLDVVLTPSEMEADPDDFTLVDSGQTFGYPDSSGETGYAGLSYWDILYENGVDQYDQGRLWFRRNGIRIASAADYENPHWFFGLGVDRGQIGGENINSLELTCETLRQIAAGFSGKRGFKIAAPRVKAHALKAKARSIAMPEPEERK